MSTSSLLIDRTTATTDDQCGKKRWWYKHEGGKGIVPLKEPLYYAQGRDYHADMASLLLGDSLESVVAAINWPSEASFDLLEPIARRIGMAVAFEKWVLPVMTRGRRVVMVEKEMVLARPPLYVAFTDDVVLEREEDGLLEVIDFKGTKGGGKGFFDHWRFAIQLHINMKGTEEELGKKVARAQVYGWQKGYEEGALLRHPYVHAYADGQGGWSEKWKYGWTLTPVWTYREDPKEAIREWVLSLGEEVALNLFPVSAPVCLDERLLNQWIEERTAREKEIVLGVARFPHALEQCRPVIGAVCPYLEACHNASINAAPLESGLYIPREPHHDVEIVGIED